MPSDRLQHSPPGARHRLVLLHGWGADADDLMPLGEALTADLDHPVERVALRAPQLHPEGVGRQWYGLFPADWGAVPDARQELADRLQALARTGPPLQATVVLGFSQGAAMALVSGCDLPLAGLIACSGYPHPGWTPPCDRPPVLLLHGRSDEVVPFSASENLQMLLNRSTKSANAVLGATEEGHSIGASAIPTIQATLRSWWS